jgi:hypothetical protein
MVRTGAAGTWRSRRMRAASRFGSVAVQAATTASVSSTWAARVF